MDKYLFYISTALICVFVLIQGGFEYKKMFPSEYEVTFFDVELGDAILIQTPEGKSILIDSSYDSDIVSKLSKYMGFFDKSLDIFVLTHGDSDHVGGAERVLDQYKVDKIFFSGADKDSPVYRSFYEKAQEKRISQYVIDKKTDFLLDENIIIDVIYPFEDISYMEDHGNDESLVFILSVLGSKILFTGDVEKEVEKKILLSGEDLNVDILKVAHHGSKSSSIEAFVSAVSPKYAIAQADEKNKFGHPHKIIVERYEENGVNFMQTGISGDVKFEIRKDGIVISD